MSTISESIYCFGDFELSLTERALRRDGLTIPLAPKTFEVLACLVARSGRVVPKSELLAEVWPDSFVEEGNLTQHVFCIRKALGDKANAIVTVPGRGYQMTFSVTTVDPAQMPMVRPVVASTEMVDEMVEQTFVRSEASRWPIDGLRHLEVRTRVVMRDTLVRLETRRLRGMKVAVACAVALAAGGALLWHSYFAPIPGTNHRIVLAAFENKSGDAQFDIALNTLLQFDLEQSPFVNVAEDAGMKSALRMMEKPSNTAITPAIAQEICQRLNDQIVLTGQLTNVGSQYLLTLRANDCVSGANLIQTRAIASGREKVIAAVDKASLEMRRRLGDPLRLAAETPLQPVNTASMEALQAYSRAHVFSSTGQGADAIPLYRHAIDLDPKFAAAYFELAWSYGDVLELTLQHDALAKAYEYRDNADGLLRLRIINSFYGSDAANRAARIQNLLSWTQLYPNQVTPWLDLADAYERARRYDDALAAAKRAVALDPHDGKAFSELATEEAYTGHYEEAKIACEQAFRLGVSGGFLHSLLYDIAWMQHDKTGMDAQIAWEDATGNRHEIGNYLLMAEGRAHEGVANSLDLMASYRRKGLTERADRWTRVMLRREADIAMNAELTRQLKTLDPSVFPLNFVFAYAELGRVAEADVELKKLEVAQESDGGLSECLFPQAQAAVALAHHQPEKAVSAMAVSLPFDDCGGIEGKLMRGRALLAAGHAEAAEEEFTRVMNIPMAVVTPFFSLAQLGRARAYAFERKRDESLHDYKALLAYWRNADADFPPLLQARHEYAAEMEQISQVAPQK